MNEALNNVMNIARGLLLEVRARNFTPKAVLIGKYLLYPLRNYYSFSAYRWDIEERKETLFGLPIKLLDYEPWGLSIEIEEFSVDLESEFCRE